MTEMTDEKSNLAPQRRPRRWIAILAVVLVVATAVLIYRNFFETYHLVEVDPGKLYRDGNRSLREFKNSLRKSGAKTVIATVDQQEYNEPEFVQGREYAKAHGLEYVWIPIRAGWYPTADQVKQFLAIATDPAKQPVLYHDDEGIRRAGMMMAAYQESVLGYDDANAKAAIQAFGHSDRTIDEVREFIDAYDPVKGLTVDLNALREQRLGASATRPTTPSATRPTTPSATRPIGE
jgi:protein tyrosine phosphatase (PTP) superfamily phosphohydrolase (DUF442 family)